MLWLNSIFLSLIFLWTFSNPILLVENLLILANFEITACAAQAPPLPSYSPPSLPLWVSSLHVLFLLLPAFLPHFWIYTTQPLTSNLDLPQNTSSLHPSSLLLLHAPCCTQDQLIYSSHFVFLSFAPLIVGVNGVCGFFSCIDLSICPTFVYCFNSIICYWYILEVSWGCCIVLGFSLLLPRIWMIL
jgi:hypothetical protein